MLHDSGRRSILRSMLLGSSLGPAVISELLASEGDPLAPRMAHQTPRAKRVIMIYLTGGVSHIDTFDPKPSGKGRDGTGKDGLMGSIFGYRPDPVTGIEVTDIFPHVRSVMSEICLIRSMKSAHFDHSEATLGVHTGSPTFARPSFGSWVSYGLGSMNRDLPSFMVIAPHLPYGGTQVYNNDFLPAYHQGTRVVPGPTPIDNLDRRSSTEALQRLELDLAQQMNRRHGASPGDRADQAARIRSFETAFRMQTAGAEAFDLSRETEETHALYAMKRGATDGFGWQCLVARRLAERGVRFIELIDTGSRPNWDSHGEMKEHEKLALNVDQPIAGLIKDLKRSGMLEETLVICATEFGRTPKREGNNGRGHHGDCFSMWLAGGGVKGGQVYGATDDIGATITRDEVEVHDLHATALHLLGMDHEQLTHRHAGRDFRLTDVFGHVMHDILV